MGDQGTRALIKVLEFKGLQSVMVKNTNKLALFLTAQDTKGKTYTFKVRHGNMELFSRELDFFTKGQQRRVPGIPALGHLNGIPSGCKLTLGKEIFSVIVLQDLGKNGNEIKRLVTAERNRTGGDIPDLFRQILLELSKILAKIHSQRMALGGFDLSDICLHPHQTGQHMHLMFTEAGFSAVDASARRYVAEVVQIQTTRPAAEFASDAAKAATFMQVTPQTPSDLVFYENDGRYYGLDPEAESDPMLLRRSRDERALALCMCNMLSQEDCSKTKVDELISAGNTSDFGNCLKCPVNRAQQPCVARLFKKFVQLLQNEKSAEQIKMSKAAQFSLYTSEEFKLLSGPGIPVLPKEVPQLKHKVTRQPQKTANLLLVARGPNGTAVIAGSQINSGDLLTTYAGNECSSMECSKYVVKVEVDGNMVFIDGGNTPNWPVSRYVAQAQVGHLLNSCRKQASKKAPKAANVVIDFAQVFRDEHGVLQVPMFACKQIKAGDECVWCYDYNAMER